MEFTEKSEIVFHLMTICSGGMPRTTHGDRFTVTVIKEDEDHVTYELTSRVIGFEVRSTISVVIADKCLFLLILKVLEYESKPECLVILAEEELVFIDLGSYSLINTFLYLEGASFHISLDCQPNMTLSFCSFQRLASLPAALSSLDPRERHHLPIRGLLA